MTDASPSPGRPEPPPALVTTDTNPYIGPRAFEEKDSDIFFGRSREIRELASLVIAHRAVLFYAQSGAGKTSLLQAGLVPRLRERKKIIILPIGRVGGDLPAGVLRSEVNNVYVFNLLLNLLGQDVDPHDLVSLNLVDGLKSFFAAQSPVDEVRPRPRLLILDQFEELFTTHPDRYPERANFFLQLQQALATYPQLSLLLSMREDHIAHLDSYAVQMPDRLRIHYRMERLYYKVALEAVREPAGRAGLPFAPGVAQELIDNLRRIQAGTMSGAEAGADPAVMETVIRLDRPFESFTPAEQAQLRSSLADWLDLSPEQVSVYKIEEGSVILSTELPSAAAGKLEAMVRAGDPRLKSFQLTEVTLPPPAAVATALGSYVEPVHLQIVCRQLWANLPSGRTQILADDVQAFGDVDQALLDFYEQALETVVGQTAVSNRLLRLWFDDKLITPARTRGVVHRGAEETAGLPNAALDLLNNAYLIRADIRGNEMWYELTHDRLLEPIIAANRQWQATYQNPLAAAHKLWLAAGRDPQKLLKGTQLEEAEAYAEEFPAEVTEAEGHFLAESQYQARQAARRRRNLVLAAIAVIILLSLCTVSAIFSARQAEDRLYQAKTAQARANQQKAAAEAAGGTAIAEGYRAGTAQANAFFQRDNAAAAEADAVQRRLEAQTAGETAVAERDRAATAGAEALFQEGQANRQKATAEAAGGTAVAAGSTAVAAGSTAGAERDNAATAEVIANAQRATAQASGATALAERDLAATAQAQAEQERAAANAARLEADQQRAAAETAAAAAQAAEATAQAERDNAEIQACLAQTNLAKTLAAHAQAILDQKTRHRDLALLLAREAVLMDQTANCSVISAPETALLAAINEPWRGTITGDLRSFSPNGTRLVTGSVDLEKSWLYNTQDASLIAGPLAGDFPVAFSPDETRLATGDYPGSWLYNAQDGSLIAGPLAGGFSVAFSPDGTRLATDDDNESWLYSTQDGSPIAGPLAGDNPAFSPDGTRLATWDFDFRKSWLYNTQDGSLIAGPLAGITLAFSPDGTRLTTSDYSNSWLYNAQDGSLIAGPLAGITLAFSPDGTRLVAPGSWLYNAQDGSLIAGPLAGDNPAFSPDGTRLATDESNESWLYSTQDGSPIAGPLAGGTPAFSPDGTRLVTCDECNAPFPKSWLYNTQDGSLIAGPLAGSPEAFSPDGTRLVTCDGCDFADFPGSWLYNTQDGSLIAGPLAGPASTPAFNQDGTRLAMVDRFVTAWLYNTQDGSLIVGPVFLSFFIFSPDGSTWGTSMDQPSTNHLTHLWDILVTMQNPTPPDQLLQIGLNRVLRNPPQLTAAERAEFGLD